MGNRNPLSPLDDSNHQNHPIQVMIQEPTTQISPISYPHRAPESSAIWVIGMVVGVGLVAVGAWSSISQEQIGVTEFVLFAAGAVLTVFSKTQANEVNAKNDHIEAIDLRNAAHLELLERTRIEQRIPAVQAVTAMEVSRMGNITTLETTRMQTDAQVKVSENEAQAVVGKAKYDALAVGAQLDHEIEVIEIKDKSATEEAAKIRDWQTGETRWIELPRLNRCSPASRAKSAKWKFA